MSRPPGDRGPRIASDRSAPRARSAGHAELGAAERVWFAPGSPVALEMVRWLVVVTVLVDLWRVRGDLDVLPERAGVAWEPISVLGLIGVGPPSGLLVGALVGVCVLGCLLGLRPGRSRVPAVAGAVAYTLLVMGLNSLGKIDHSHQPLVVMVLAVSLVAVSRLDAPYSWRYRWPVQLSRAAFAVMLFAAAWSKLSEAGLDWVLSENLRTILVMEVQVLRDPPLGELSLWVAADPWRWYLVAAGAVLGEGLLLLALVVRRQPFRALLVVAGTGSVVGITLLMGLVGFPIVVLALAFLDVEAVVDTTRTLRRRIAAAVVGVGAVTVLAWTTFQDTSSWVTLAPLAAATGVVVVASLHRSGSSTSARGPVTGSLAGAEERRRLSGRGDDGARTRDIHEDSSSPRR